MKLIFAHFLAAEIVIAVPFLVKLILHEAHVMAEAECTVVIDDTVQVVQGLDLQRIFEEFRITAELCHVEVSYWKIDQILQLTPLITV